MQKVRAVSGCTPTTCSLVLPSQQYSSLDTLGSPSSSITHDHTIGSDTTSEDEAKAQPKLSPLPARAYSKPPDIDPLSPPEGEATYSDDEFATLDEKTPSKGPVEGSHENARFYGKSSVVVLTNKLVNERCKETGARFMPERRKEFWTIPDVSSTVVCGYSITDTSPVDDLHTGVPTSQVRLPRHWPFATPGRLLL